MRQALLALLLIASAALGAGVSFDEVQGLPFTAPDARLPYGDHPDQYGLLWRAQSVPAGNDGTADAAPLVVLVHGGCWLDAYSVDHIRPLASALAVEGFSVWAPEYRRVGGEGGDPATLDDLRAAIALIPTLKDPRGPVTAQDIAFVGHSAGGHLALWAASDDSGVRPAPQLALGLAAITDLAAYAAEDNSCSQALEPFMGGGVADLPARYRALSPAFADFAMPVFTLQGRADPIVPATQASAPPAARPVFLPDAGHFDLIDPRGAAFQRLLKVLREGLGLDR
jgi:acetyl esterase/lipase